MGAYKSKQQEEALFQTRGSERFEGHSICGIVTVHRAVTVYRA